MKLAICADHGGFALKEQIKAAYPDIEWLDVGATHDDPLDDYPDFAFTLAMVVAGGHADRGIAVCGTGAGVCMALNRHPMIRAAVCMTAEVASKVREHNDANVLCLGGRLMTIDQARAVIDAFTTTSFSTDPKYARRNRKLSLIDDEHNHDHDGDHNGCCGGGCH
jgi:ribose 5-phosphate isomerase B